MLNQYSYDVFISFSHEDKDTAEILHKKITDFGVKAFWAKDLPRGKDYPSELETALRNSRHFVLHYSKNATKSSWVHKEWETFLDLYHLPDRENRRMYVLLDNECDPKLIPERLQQLQRPNSIDELLAALMREVQREYQRALIQLEEQHQKVSEAQGYYQYNRFWGPFAKNGEVHIFTCGRDVIHDPDTSRGTGGRTNIDMWDYRTVLDINHFFATKYPNTKISIADPVSKLQDSDLEDMPRLAKRIANMQGMLEDKDCIIIGSPDVSDFAEIFLTEIHHIDPYVTEGRVKQKGFAIIKEQKKTRSSCYWAKEANEQEGVVQIIAANDYQSYPYVPADKDGGKQGEMYGIVIVANNPFRRRQESKDQSRRIIILSGFSGVATNAMAKVLTDENYLDEFFKLDNAYVNIDQPIEALIKVQYEVDRYFAKRDTRRIKAINFEKVVVI